jgi:hypothetical protein
MRILFFPSLAYNEFMTLLGNCVQTNGQEKEKSVEWRKKAMRNFLS